MHKFLKIIHHHQNKHQGLDPLIRPVSRVTAARAIASSVFQLFSFPLICSGMISKGFGFVAQDSKLFFGIKLYIFRTVPLSIIRSFSLYTQQWHMS